MGVFVSLSAKSDSGNIMQMPTAFDKAFGQVKDLVANFKANESYYLSPQLSEAQTRKDFIDKFFIALGWDVNHDTQKNPYEQEVKIEKNESGSQRRADYAFSLSPSFRDVRFFVEAKKPHGEFGSADNYFQALCYGWNGKTPLVVLTNFDELHILDSRYKPHIADTLSRVVKKFSYNDYADCEKFAEIYWLFSREAVSDNSLTKRAEELPRPKSKTLRRELFQGGGQSPDEAFLIELDGYREMLARAFKSKNPNLNSAQLTEITQRVIDRLVFIRFLEDKQIEPTRHVERFGADGGSAWEDFVRISVNLDRIYNGVVFKRHEILDAPGFQIDEKPFRIICEELADPTSPYNFATIPIHILGSIYERFLGKIITDGARVVEKPEVRKAGGVYYTPEYIVRYIVANTVGKAVEGKTPADIAGMRFADIACGSGSFLLEVFDLLVRRHAKFYNENPGMAKKGDCVPRDDGLHLSLKKKQEILRNNIYGVDIDRQAVEVAQLSLYLKLLEDETIGSAAAFQNEFHFTLLPPLTGNIVCGNSLIGTDILETGNFTPEEERKLSPMDFEQRFPQIFRRRTSGGELHDAPAPWSDYTLPGVPLHGAYATVSYKKKKGEKPLPPPEMEYEGGFDAIVGNPPYVRIQGFPQNQIAYLSKHYRSVKGNCDLYVSFVERGYELLNSGGKLGQIVPNKFLKTDYGENLRHLIAAHRALNELVDFGANQVFEATTYTCLLFLSKTSEENFRYAQSDATPEALARPAFVTQSAASLSRHAWLFADERIARIIEKLSRGTKRLLDLPAAMSRGSSSGDDDVFMVQGDAMIEKALLRIPVFATDFNRYTFAPAMRWWIIFPYEPKGGAFPPFPENELKSRFPKACAYLKSKRAALQKRKQYAKWFLFSAPRNLRLHDQAQIAVPLLADRGLCALIPKSMRGTLCPMASGGFTITLSPECKLKPEYVLGLLNSRLLFWKLQNSSNIFRGGWVPLPKIDFSTPTDKARHDKLVSLVQRMLEARRQLAAAKTDGDQIFYSNKCAGLDGQIDALVYELYGLSSEEIKIVEGEKEILVGQPLSEAGG
jgi:type I restriction-modification system DNA methylase subunit